MDVHGQDVHDRACRFPPAHVLDACCMRKNGARALTANIGPGTPAAGEERGAIGQAGGVDERVDPAEPRDAGRDDRFRGVSVGQVRGDEGKFELQTRRFRRLRPCRVQRRGP